MTIKISITERTFGKVFWLCTSVILVFTIYDESVTQLTYHVGGYMKTYDCYTDFFYHVETCYTAPAVSTALILAVVVFLLEQIFAFFIINSEKHWIEFSFKQKESQS